MLSPLKVAALLSVAAFGTEVAFQSRTVESAQLSAAEAEKYERIKRAPGTLKVRLVAFDERNFSAGKLQVEGFNEGKGEFLVRVDGKSTAWRGKSVKNYDWFVIRKTGDMYSGFILNNGRQFGVLPIKPGVSALYLLDGVFDCEVVKPFEEKNANEPF